MVKNNNEYRIVAMVTGGVKSVNAMGEDSMTNKVLEYMDIPGFSKCIVENKVTKERVYHYA